MAMPQWAMAQFGSASLTAVKALGAWGNQNECSMATARLNCAWASALHDIGKSTLPSFSCAPAMRRLNDNAKMVSNENFNFVIAPSSRNIELFDDLVRSCQHIRR